MSASLDPGLLAAMVVGGVGLVVAVTHLKGGTRTVALVDEADVRTRFAVDFPDAGVRSVALADDRRAALLELDDGRTALLFAVGDDVVTRSLQGKVEVREVGDTLHLRLPDFGSPRVRIRLGDPEQRTQWRHRLHTAVGAPTR